MQEVKSSLRITLILAVSLFYLAACTHLGSGVLQKSPRPEVTSEARELLSVLEKHNDKLQTFKGTGRISFQKSGKKDAVARIAWIGAFPDRLRIMLHNVSGQPLISIAADGHWVYFFSHAQGQYSKQRSSSAFLQKFFSISIPPEDIIHLLAGRVPLKKYYLAATQKDGLGDGFVLVLKSAWENVVEKVYFAGDKRTVRKFEMYDQSEDVLCRVEFSGEQIIDGYQIPNQLIFSDRDASGFQLEIDRYWADIAVAPSTFVLAPPEGQSASPQQDEHAGN